MQWIVPCLWFDANAADAVAFYIDNVFIERFWRSVKYEEVYLHAYQNVREEFQHAAIAT